jgi:thiamine-phosphate pyrophosphorylase
VRAASAGPGLHARLLVVADESVADVHARTDAALGALPRGGAAVQLRCKSLGGRGLLAAAEAMAAIAERHGATLVVNDRADVALAVGGGVHLPARGLPVAAASDLRRRFPRLGPIGVSTHAIDEALAAERDGADYVTFGPVWATPSKAALGEPVGVAALSECVRAMSIPVYALGGVDLARAAACAEAGARVACIRAVLDAPDPAAAARALWASIAPR